MRNFWNKAIADNDVYEPTPKVSYELDDDGVTVFDARGGTYWRGNTTAADVMVAVQQRQSVSQLVTNLQNRYGVHRDEAGDDVRALLQDLRRNGVVRRART